MTSYNNILLGVDFHPLCDELVTQRAVEMAKALNAKLTILHIVEKIHTYGVELAYAMILDVEDALAKEATTSLRNLGGKYNIAPERQIVEVGDPTILILEQAKKLQADLIIVGSHGRHGVRLLLGSTANGVLHHAHCDVLAIRVKNSK